MERSTRVLLTVVIMALGAAGLLALTVYPFQYGLGESLILVGALVGALLFQTVLDDTSF
ncbi:hypothetical protein [Halohasta litorea]|uniref:Uncharacterized protein n=1 Tax=Halohasta litorea TaxID=869891 RepID=A0ABD6D6V4_9EURY|nr:hypothetical protein [Halohasta litorea]